MFSSQLKTSGATSVYRMKRKMSGRQSQYDSQLSQGKGELNNPNNQNLYFSDDIMTLIDSYCHSLVIISNDDNPANKVLNISSLFIMDDWFKNPNIKQISDAILVHEAKKHNNLYSSDEELRENMRNINGTLQNIDDEYDTYIVNTIYEKYKISIYFKLECGYVSLFMTIENKENMKNICFKTITINNIDMELDQYRHYEKNQYTLSTTTNAYGWKNKSIYSAFAKFMNIIMENENMINIHMTFTED